VKKLSALSPKIEAPLQAASNILMLLILVLVFAEVVSRYVFHESRGFMEEFSKWSQIWITYLMLGVVEKKRQHIVVDILPRRLSEKYRTVLLIILDIVTLVFCILLFWSGVQTTQNWILLGYRSTMEWAFPMWIIVLCMPLGAIFLAFFSMVNLVNDSRSLSNYQRGKE
jgi:TRAP-type C4-dicarboxylate transport system permease small subunit